MERTFFFLGFCLPSIRAVWRGFNSDSVLPKLFSGDMDFRKTETNLFLNFVRAEEGSGEESARTASSFFKKMKRNFFDFDSLFQTMKYWSQTKTAHETVFVSNSKT
jgi:hypothetical protein